MKKKITSAIKSRTVKIVASLKRTRKIVYLANPKSHIPHDIAMPAPSFYGRIEKHLQNEATIVPVIKEKITWKKFVKYNRGFKQLRIEIIRAEGRNYPDKAWDNVANRVIKVLKKNHEPLIVSKKH